MRAFLLGLMLLVALPLCTDLGLAAEPRPAASSAPKMDFVPPRPGTYQLPPIQKVPAGTVLDTDAYAEPFSRYVSGRITLLSFIYSYCTDPTGCPLAYDAFVDIRQRARAAPDLRGKVRLVSLSFDPVNDTPDVMRMYGGAQSSDSAVPWHFLTTRSMGDLMPLLDGFGQDARVELNASGQPTRAFSHMLKVFLIDARGRVREIYTTAFLLPEVMINDIRTLLMETDAKGRTPAL